ncbi:MAG: ABC transporter permease [Parvibaculaceae bacterium]
MKADRIIAFTLKAYIWLVLLIVFAPILTSFVFSFDANKFASIPWGGFSTRWYAEAFADPDVAKGFRNTAIVALVSSLIATAIGFTAAYTDYRYDFFGKKAYLALAFIPPTIPVIILGVAMLVYLGRIGLSGELHSVIIAHVVYSLPFAMALIRLRLSQMNKDLEAAAWNLGASQWQALREVIIPFCLPAIFSAMFLTMAVSFDEYAIAWFVSGFNETLPVRILILLQREVSPKVNAIGSLVFVVSMTLVMLAQIVFLMREPGTGKGKSI